MEWDIDDQLPPEMRDYAVAPGPAYTFFAPYNGPDNPLSSDKICTYENISAFFSSEPVTRNRKELKAGSDPWYVSLALTNGYWAVVFDQLPIAGIDGRFDPKTGEFLYAKGEMIWEM